MFFYFSLGEGLFYIEERLDQIIELIYKYTSILIGILIQNTPITTPELIFNISTFLPIFYLGNPMCVYRF